MPVRLSPRHQADVSRRCKDPNELHHLLVDQFRRPEPRRHALAYLEALLGRVERKNSWQIAEHAGEISPYGIQHLLCKAVWDADDLRNRLQRYVADHLADPQGVLIVDETGFLKKGDKSAGVQRQYSGTAGRIENCQIGVFLAYATSKGTAFPDRELYLPKSWTDDEQRRREAGIPEDVPFQTKGALAIRMLERALQAGVPAAWVTGDAIYGQDRTLRRWLEEAEQPFVLAVPQTEKPWVWWDKGPQQIEVRKIVERLQPGDWQTLSAGEGTKGPRLYDWALAPLYRLQIGTKWQHALLVRRNLADGELAYYVVFAPPEATLLDLVRVAGTRWAIEAGFEAAKGEVGLDHYEVRTWRGWYRHITLALLAHAWLSVVRHRMAQAEAAKGGPTPAA